MGAGLWRRGPRWTSTVVAMLGESTAPCLLVLAGTPAAPGAGLVMPPCDHTLMRTCQVRCVEKSLPNGSRHGAASAAPFVDSVSLHSMGCTLPAAPLLARLWPILAACAKGMPSHCLPLTRFRQVALPPCDMCRGVHAGFGPVTEGGHYPCKALTPRHGAIAWALCVLAPCGDLALQPDMGAAASHRTP